MKKIIYLFFLAFFSLNLALAQDVNEIQNLLETGTMPTDEQIWQTIEQFGIEESQKEEVFYATKMQLEEMFRTKQVPEIYQNMNMDAIKEMNASGGVEMPLEEEKTYASHDPIFVKQRYGPQRD